MRKRLLVLAGMVVLAAIIHRQHASWFEPESWMRLTRSHPVAAPGVFVAGYVLAGFVLLPTLTFNLAAGFLWGPWTGALLSIIGSVTSAVVTFSIARATVGRATERLNGPLARQLQQAFHDHGWKIVAFVRLNPIFPGPVNYFFGLTSIGFGTYLWASLVFLSPPTLAFAFLGHSMGMLALTGGLGRTGDLLKVGGAAVLFLAVSALVFRRLTANASQTASLTPAPPDAAVLPDGRTNLPTP